MRPVLWNLLESIPNAVSCVLRQCAECCKTMHMSKEEWDLVMNYANNLPDDIRGVVVLTNDVDDGITITGKTGRCPFLKEGKCLVYQVRPFVCRVFGQSLFTLCTHIGNPKREELVPESIFEQYVQLTGVVPFGYTKHGFLEAAKIKKDIESKILIVPPGSVPRYKGE